MSSASARSSQSQKSRDTSASTSKTISKPSSNLSTEIEDSLEDPDPSYFKDLSNIIGEASISAA